MKKLHYIVIVAIFIIAVYLRAKIYLINQSFWHDECALAWNIVNNDYSNLLNPLRFLQVAPPAFLLITKFLTLHFGISEYIFRFFPLLTSILSIFAFYFLSKKLLNTDLAIICANLLFAVNFPLYYYASEFKPYSSDVLFTILAFLVFLNINKKYIFISACLLSLFVWFSFPTAFFTGGMLIVLFLSKKYNMKEKLLFTVPFLFSSIVFYNIYFIKIFNYSKYPMQSFWNNEFINLNNIYLLLTEAVKFLFSPSFLIPLLILLGIIIFIKEKNIFIKVSLIAFSLILAISGFKLYPFAGRLILFLLPVLLICQVKPLDKKSIFIFIIFIFSITAQIGGAFDTITKKVIFKKNSNPREMIVFIKNNSRPEDIIFVNTFSNADFLYYKDVFNVNNKYIIEDISQIKKNDKVWFFIPNNSDINFKQNIKNNYNIEYENVSEFSFLIYAIKK